MDEDILKIIHILKLNILGCDNKMNGKNDIHVIESNLRPYPGNERKFQTSCSQKK